MDGCKEDHKYIDEWKKLYKHMDEWEEVHKYIDEKIREAYSRGIEVGKRIAFDAMRNGLEVKEKEICYEESDR
jgi:hypothetical protein